MVDREKKRGGQKYKKKIEYLENETRFLDEIKRILQFLKGYHSVKKKKKIADTSFKDQKPCFLLLTPTEIFL